MERPLVLAGLGLAVGAALGIGIPMSRREHEIMGDSKEELVGSMRSP